MNKNTVIKKANKLGTKNWLCIILFGLVGQLAWMVENMYFSTFIQANITKDAWATSAAVASSAIVAAVATIFGGALSDRLGNRKIFVSFGYIIWGIVTASFALFGNEQITSNITLIVILFALMDCIMTFFGSISNDAAYNAWVTDITDITNRGLVDVIISMMPIAALMIIFVGFDGLTKNGQWSLFYIILGVITIIIGIIGLFIFKDHKDLKPNKDGKYLKNVFYGFEIKNVKSNKMIYICFIAMLFSSLSLQMWQPYMISLFQYTLGIENYVIPIAIIVVLAAIVSVLGGKLMDKFGKTNFFYPVALIGVLGGLICYIIKFVNPNNDLFKMILLIIGGTLIMGGNMMCCGLFLATSRDYTPKDKVGCFQGVRIVIAVMLPMVIASILCPFVINVFGTEPSIDLILNGAYKVGDKVYPYELFIFSAIIALFVFIPSFICKKKDKAFREEKLKELNIK